MQNKNIQCLVLLVAGNSTRFCSDVKKQFISVDGVPLFIHTLHSLIKFPFDRIVIVASDFDMMLVKNLTCADSTIAETLDIEIEFVVGGAERVYSVFNAMNYLKMNNAPKYVFIHDGVRPLVTLTELDSLAASVKKNNAAILAIKINDTIKRVGEHGNIIETIDRVNVYRAATPQAFLFSLYFEAITKYLDGHNKIEITDDAEIYSLYNGDVFVVSCSAKNIKITEVEDIPLYQSFRLIQAK